MSLGCLDKRAELPLDFAVLWFCSAAKHCDAKGFWGGKILPRCPACSFWVERGGRLKGQHDGLPTETQLLGQIWDEPTLMAPLTNKIKNYQQLWNWKINWVSTMTNDLWDSFVVWSPSTVCIYFLANDYTFSWIILQPLFERFKYVCLPYLYHWIPGWK